MQSRLMQGGLTAAAVVFSGSACLLLSSSAGLAQSRWQMGVQKLLLPNYQSLDFLQLKHFHHVMTIQKQQAVHGTKTATVL